MEDLKIIFSNEIEKNINHKDLSKIIKSLVEKVGLNQLKNQENSFESSAVLFLSLFEVLMDKDLINDKNVKALINGIINVRSFEQEQLLYKKIYEKEELEKFIYLQKEKIYFTIDETFSEIKNAIKEKDLEKKDEILGFVENCEDYNTKIMGILKETTEVTYLAILEKAEDVENTSREVTKNIIFEAINEGNFIKKRILYISEIVLEVAINLADRENSVLAKYFLNGVIDGVRLGIIKSIDKFKDDLKFQPNEIEYFHGCCLATEKKELFETEEDFILLLKKIRKSHKGLSKQILEDFLDEMPDVYFIKMKRMAQEASVALSEKLESLKGSASIIEQDIKDKTIEKISSLKKDMLELEVKANEGLKNLKEASFSSTNEQSLKEKTLVKISSLKKDMLELEVKANEAISNFKEMKLTKQVKVEAKKMTENTWKKAKELLNNAKDALKK